MQEIEQIILDHEELIKKAIFKLKIYRDFEEYMQVGRIALWKAAKSFDKTKGEFAMFAYMTVKYAITRELSRSIDVSESEISVEEEVYSNVEQQPAIQPSLEWPEWFSKLKEDEQFLLKALFLEDLNLKEVADKYGLPYEALKKRRQRLFTKIRKIVEQRKGETY
ncbi:sigma-70 family RNA polymerase sigma factor [Solibacillus ferritrahens]|uniref:sigma-70 family RNA polymerase sigma factor n=1 Tax=Solibacillus ferritrahens TaxID=3098620 RepID=UPI00300875EF